MTSSVSEDVNTPDFEDTDIKKDEEIQKNIKGIEENFLNLEDFLPIRINVITDGITDTAKIFKENLLILSINNKVTFVETSNI